jgi:hypothetical protein
MSLIIVSIVTGLFACDRRPSNFEGGSVKERAMMAPPAKQETFVNSKTVERKLIKSGMIEFSTKSVSDMRKEIDKLTKEFNAYISSDNQQKIDGKIEHEQVIRVPAGRFDAFVKVVEELGDQIEFRNVGTEDVTEEYIDVEARLKTKKELEIRYHQLLTRANNVKEMLAVEEQISNVRSEIESMQGRINFLSDQVGYSTLTVKYYQVTSTQFGFGSRAIGSFVTGWRGLLTFLIGIISAWPFILILAGSMWLISRWSKRINLRLTKKSQQA